MLYGSVGRVGLRALLGSVAYTPLSLFAAGEQGVWLDNSDFTTLFQDAAGTTPVTGYEQFVGLRLDKSKGLVLGSELVTNGDFSNGSAGWTVNTGWTISGGKASFSAGVGAELVQTGLSFAANTTYKITFDMTQVSGGGFRFVVDTTGSFVSQYFATTASHTLVFSVGATSTRLRLGALGGASFSIDNISVRELPGNHAYQTTTTARAVLSARYNLLTQTENQSSGVWVDYNATQQSNVGIAPNGTNTADRIVESNGVSFQTRYQSIAGGLNIEYTVSAYAKADQRNVFNLSYSGTAGSNWFAATFSLTGGGSVLKTGAGANGSYTRSSITPVGDGWYLCQVTGTTGQASTHYIYPGPSDTTNPTYQSFGLLSYSGNSANGIFVWGVDVRVANESSALPAYQRVGAAVNGTSTSIGTPDYDTVGFPAYLRYDGGDWYQTGSINFSTGATNPPALGPNLNPGFAAYSVVLTGTWSASGSNYVFTDTVGGQVRPGVEWPTSSLVAGTYKIDIVVASITGASQLRLDGLGSSDILVGTGTTSRIVSVTTLSKPRFRLEDTSTTIGDGFAITSVSVVAVDANYAPDKMSVFTGVRKFNAAGSFGILVELSSAAYLNPGSFAIAAPGGLVGNTDNFGFTLVGSGTAGYDAVSYPPPFTAILAVQYNIGAASPSEEVVPRINAVLNQTGGAGTTAGTGTFGNYPLYIGARNAGASLPFTGRDYGFVIVGRAVTATELANTEGYMETQTFGKDMAYVYSDELTTATGDLITAADGDQIYMTVQYV